MTAALPIAAAPVSAGGWRTHLFALGGLAAALLLLFHRDAADMVRIWLESSTFNHCALIPPIIAWLVAQRWPGLRRIEPAAWWPGLAIVAAGAFGWLLGEAAGVALARHLGLVLMLQGAVIATLGHAVARALAFPLFFALFMVPAGEELVPPMQHVTAHLAMALLALSGVPAHLDGIFITTANGYFEVAEACAGVKFLIAMVALGALVANLCFTSWRRRIAFMAAAVAIPILANGVRAWGTIVVTEHRGVETASSFDHVVYGWVFFAVVIAATLAAGWRFFDRAPTDPWFDPAVLQPSRPGPSPLAPIAAAALAIGALPIAWSAAIASGASVPAGALNPPEVPGWTRAAPAGLPWRPAFANADRFVQASYRSTDGQRVDLAIAVYARQAEGRELVGFGQGAASGWANTGTGPAPAGGRLDRLASRGALRETATFYRVGDTLTGSPAAVKLATACARLLGGPQRAVAILVSAEAPADGISPRPAIDAFVAALGPLEPLADRAAGLPSV